MSEHEDRDYSQSDDTYQSEDITNDVHLSRRQFLKTTVAAPLVVSLAPTDEAVNSVISGAPPKPVAPPVVGPGEVTITLRINGVDHRVALDPRVTLLDALRERLQLTGTKKGCDLGQCGACTVLVNGRRVNSCLALAMQYQGAEITTIEGLGHNGQLHPVQAAFVTHDGFQCGYCTSGQIMSAVGLINEGHAQSDADVQELMSGNICRCGAYVNILAAVNDARAAVAAADIQQL